VWWVSGCSGPQIHSELTADEKIMIRKWTVPTHGSFEIGDHGTEYSSPILAENTLIFVNRTTGLVALYPAINQMRWSVAIPGGVPGELTLDQSSIYFAGGDGFLYSVNLDNGHVNWKHELRINVASKPTVSGGRVFVTTSDDVVYALDAGTGKWLWHYRRRSLPIASIYGASSPLVDGNEVIVGMSDGFLIALSLEEGQLKWEKKLHSGSKFTDVNAHPVLENGVIYVPSYDGALYALKRSGGDILWRFDAGGSKNVALSEDSLFLPSSDGWVYSLQKNNAKIQWKFQLDHGVPTQLVITDQYVIVASSYQYLYLIDKVTGKGVYRFNAGYNSGFSGSPLFDPHARNLYVLSGAGNLYAFELRKRQKKAYPHGALDPYVFN
jgi:outer membrane protein assembly factor BamB